MANVVLGFGSSHAPQLRIRAEHWPQMIEKDRNDPRFDYQRVLELAKPGMDSELTPEVMKLRDESNHRAMGVLRQKLDEAVPDVIVVVGDDQHEQYQASNQPVFSVYHGASLPIRERNRGTDPKLAAAWSKTNWREHEERSAEKDYPAAPPLAEHIIENLVETGFDIAVSNELREDIGVGHAFSFLYQYIMPEAVVPVVPVTVNAFYPPNQPTTGRRGDP